MAATEQRIIIKTDTAGWFIDPTNGDKKVRKQDGDKIVTRAEYEQMLLDAEDQPREDDPVADATATKPNADERAKELRENPPQVEVELTSGKKAVGNTVTIKCAWVDPDKRTAKQQKLFAKFAAGDRKALTYEKVRDAADGPDSMPDGRERVIKPQDAFQVRFHSDNQPKWRAELRRAKNKAKREAARKAAKNA